MSEAPKIEPLGCDEWDFLRDDDSALRAALDEAEARAVKAEAERDRWRESSQKMTSFYEHRGRLLEAALALLRDGLLAVQTGRNEPLVIWSETVSAHLGAKP